MSQGEFYVWGPTGPIAEVGTLQWTYTFDPNGSLVERIGPSSQAGDVNGANYALQGQYAIDGAYVYDAYGLLLTNWDIALNTYSPFEYKGQAGYVSDARNLGGGYPGVPTHAGNHLVNCQHRWYDPYSCRWISRDPTGLDGGENAYEYADGNPIRDVDTNGLETRKLTDQGIPDGARRD